MLNRCRRLSDAPASQLRNLDKGVRYHEIPEVHRLQNKQSIATLISVFNEPG